MPTIQFKGKNIIWNHHLSVPYHTLEEIEDLHFQPEKADLPDGKAGGNIIVEGDNLIALKALLPQYAGKVKCIYIDPPYNTGNEGWVYNDKVNSPLINEWLGKEVGTDDLTRHDKWLCMMTPRLQLLKDLLSNDGIIFVSIDDNEYHNLKAILDEMYGERNFITTLIWQKKTGASDAKTIATITEYILVYSKDYENEGLSFTKNKQSYDLNRYRHSDSHNEKRGPYYIDNLDRGGLQYSNSMNYGIKAPDGTLCFPNGRKEFENDGWIWKWGKDKVKWAIENEFLEFRESTTKDCGWSVCYKNYLKVDNEGNPIERAAPKKNLLQNVLNSNAAKEIKELFGNKKFHYPKPVGLIAEVINLIELKENAIILDSFAGSGTTMHAVNELNKEDGGNRKCILVQMTEESEQEPDKNIAKDITRERNKLAIEKYGYDTGFKYFRVGNAIDPDAMLDGELPDYAAFAKYVYYLGTGEHLATVDKIDQSTHFVGTHGPKNFYLIYEQDFDTLSRLALNLHIAEEIIAHSQACPADSGRKRIVVYAPACFLDNEYLEEKQIEYVSIPYNLFSTSEE